MNFRIKTITALFLLPFLVVADDVVVPVSTLKTVLWDVSDLLDAAKTIIFALAFLAFFYGLAKFIFSASGEEKTQGKSIMIWGIVALFIMFSIWGIIRIMQNSITGANYNAINTPAIPRANGSFTTNNNISSGNGNGNTPGSRTGGGRGNGNGNNNGGNTGGNNNHEDSWWNSCGAYTDCLNTGSSAECKQDTESACETEYRDINS